MGVLEADVIKAKDMKEKIGKEYVRRVRKILKSKLNGTNSISAINSRAVSIVRYGAGIIQWTKEELQKLDRKTRKLSTIHRAFHCRGDFDRLYVKRSKCGRGLISVEDCVNIEINSLRKHVAENDEYLFLFYSYKNFTTYLTFYKTSLITLQHYRDDTMGSERQ